MRPTEVYCFIWPRRCLRKSEKPAKASHYPGMSKATVDETLFLFLFRCDKMP